MSDTPDFQTPRRRSMARAVTTFAVTVGLGVALLMSIGISAPAAGAIALGASMAAMVLAAA